MDTINQTVSAAATHLILRPETRLLIAFVAALTLSFSVAGSVGEAAFQLRQAEDAASKREKDERVVKASTELPGPQPADAVEPEQQPVVTISGGTAANS